MGCITFLETAVNLFWVEAQLKCEEIGGYLVEPRTARYRLSATTIQGVVFYLCIVYLQNHYTIF
jgi:hypothetical protein